MSRDLLIVGDVATGENGLVRLLETARLDVTVIGPDDVLFEPWAGPRVDVVIVAAATSLDEQLALCAELRRRLDRPHLPAILIGEPGADPVSLVIALERGADEWLARPYDERELLARVHALLRRATVTRRQQMRVGSVELDPEAGLVHVAGRNVPLTRKEAELLQALLEAGGRVVRRRDLLQRAWPHAPATRPLSRTLDVHMRRLRQKLGPEAGRIVTIRSVGYRFEPVAR